jgi:hypothetical protein
LPVDACPQKPIAAGFEIFQPNKEMTRCDREAQLPLGRRRPIDAEVKLKPGAVTSRKKEFYQGERPYPSPQKHRF